MDKKTCNKKIYLSLEIIELDQFYLKPLTNIFKTGI